MAAMRAVTVALVTLIVGTSAAAAQSTLGTIRGTIFDPQHQIAPGATAAVIDEATSLSRETTSDTNGNFEVPDLRPGTYTIEASLAGFKKVQRTGVLLRATAIARADLQLEIGRIEDVVTVVAEGQNNITLESQEIARGFDDAQLRDLPRNSRDVQ